MEMELKDMSRACNNYMACATITAHIHIYVYVPCELELVHP